MKGRTQIKVNEKTAKERRQHKRSNTKVLAVAFKGQSLDTHDLSIGGTLITGYETTRCRPVPCCR